jgi:cytoskeletal protein RodZ
LEDEAYDILPGTTYAKGFLRNYARYLGLNPEEIISLYNLSARKTTEEETPLPLKPAGGTPVMVKPAVFVVLAVIAFGIICGIFYLGSLNPSPPNTGYNPSPLPTPPAVQNPGDQTPQQPVVSQPEKPHNQRYSGIVAELTFTGNCWMRVKIDGAAFVDSMNYQGDTKVLRAEREIEFVSIGNPGGVPLS